jgi:hypothetical protein
VELETTKSNEIGEPIHEECYALELSLGKATRPPPEAREEGAIKKNVQSRYSKSDPHSEQ